MTLLAERRFMKALSGCPRRSQDYNQNRQKTFDFHDFLPEYEPIPFYHEGLEGSEKRAREAARSDGFLLSYGSRPVDRYRINELKHSVSEERLEQVREIDGELAYEKMRRAVEKVSQEKARQAERARQVESRPERRGPERGGPERDFGLSR